MRMMLFGAKAGGAMRKAEPTLIAKKPAPGPAPAAGANPRRGSSFIFVFDQIQFIHVHGTSHSGIRRRARRPEGPPDADPVGAQRVDRAASGALGDVTPVGEGVFEMREHFGPGWRMYFVRRGALVIGMLGGGPNPTQQADITAAKALAATFKE